jgi:hypothetical protein
MRRLVAELRRHVPAEVPIAVATLDAVGQGVQGVPLPTLPAEGAVAVPLPAIGSPAACERYATWAGVLARALAPHLAVGARRGSLIDESRRQEAVERLTAVDLDRDEELDRIVAFARAGYGSRSAALSLIDGERTRFAVRHGVEPAEVARDASLCAVALPQRRGLLARDTRRDPRLRSLPAVLDGTAGFYAGHPVDGPDGLPVAVLCVFDPEPRPEGTDDLVLLHDLAVAARRRLFGAVADRG